MIHGIGINADSGRINGDLAVLRADLEKFHEAGFEWVEIAAHSLDVLLHGKLVQTRLQEVKKVLAPFNFKYTLHGPDPINLMDRDYPELQEQLFTSCLELAAELGAGIFVYHCGGPSKEQLARAILLEDPSAAQVSPDLQKQEQDALYRLGERARELGVTICVENSLYVPYSTGSEAQFTGARIDHLVQHVTEISHDHVKICFDIAHGHISANILGFDLVEAFRLAKPYIRHLHVHDNFGLPNQPTAPKAIDNLPFGFGDLHLAPGRGNIPYEKLIDDIKACPAVALVELNPRYQTPPVLKQIVEDLKEKLM